ncbi:MULTISPECIES: hypothetical protein [unclassified Exiguobacterium]|uniref:YobI family P-loop NTPase n=1 Tax=unclassified Exiguobacterium TaxID=2644629 RepID=UPI001BE67C2E|nr:MULTISPECIES: hypothetical protein [unclassified Exiguobacterium]
MSEEEINLEFLETLLPDTKEEESKKVYLKTLGWALENTDIKNLAITGTYGSGKSSILKTFWSTYDEKDKVLEISAATFSGEKELTQDSPEAIDAEGNSKDNIIGENVLEQHIMQQMFYKVKPEKIPLSRFTRIHNKDTWETFWDTLLMLISVLLVYVSIKYEWLYMLFTPGSTGNSTNVFLFSILFLIGISLISLAIFRAVKIAKNFRLSTLGIGSTTFELKGDKDNTVFNKYLDEIIYFFSQTGINIVVFEDLDRFNNLNIFERLRGLNHILNQSEELKGENIVFVYALKDDIFSKEDRFKEVQNRTKFFDFIIPTVKIMHSSNSESVLLTKLKNYIEGEGASVHQDRLSKKLITDVSLFISDMRILKNICNEYIIYRSALKQSGIQQDKLFAIIVYKNIYPKDFSDLLNGEGHLISLFSLKEKFISIHKGEYERKLEELEKVLSFVEKDTVDSLDGLVITYLRKMGYLDLDYSIELARENFPVSDSDRMANFLRKLLALSSNEPNIIIHARGYNRPSFNFKDFCTANGTSPDILTRARAILIKEDDEIPSFENQIKELKKNIVELKTSSFSEVIRKSNDFSIEEHLKEKDLLKVLILQGWIGEDYDEYITYFYEGAMFKEDINFLKSVRLNNPLGFDFKLKNKNEVQKKLSNEHFNNSAILNYELLSFLLSATEDELGQKRRYLIEYISEDLSANFSFISGFLERNNELLSGEVKVLIQELSEINEDLWEKIQESFNSRDQEVSFFLRLFLTNTPSMMDRLNGSGSLNLFIEQSREFLTWWSEIELDSDGIEKMKLTLEALEVRFVDLEYVEGSSDIIKVIIDNNFYEINESVLSTLLNEFNIINYGVILNHHSDTLKNRVEVEIEKFISEILLTKSSYSEEENTFLRLLNHEEVDREQKAELLEIWDGTLNDLNEVDSPDLYTNILKLNKVNLSWPNIENYCDNLSGEEGLEVLEEFITIESNLNNLIEDTKGLEDYEIEDECVQKVIELVIYSQNIDYDKFTDLISNIDREITIQYPSKVSGNRYEVLIYTELLAWQESIAEYLNEKHPELAIKYFKSKKDELANEELEHLINKSLLPWDKNIYVYLNEKENHDLAFNYLMSFEENQFLEKLEEIECDSQLFVEILRDEQLLLETKFKMVNSIKKFGILFNPEISDWLLTKLKEEGFENILNSLDKKIVEEGLLKSLEKEEDISFVLSGCIEEYLYNKKKVYSILASLPEPFSLLIIPGKRNIEFKYSAISMKFLNQLVNEEIIASVSPKDEYLSVNNKSKIRY